MGRQVKLWSRSTAMWTRRKRIWENLAGETKTMILLGGLDAVGKTTLLLVKIG